MTHISTEDWAALNNAFDDRCRAVSIQVREPRWPLYESLVARGLFTFFKETHGPMLGTLRWYDITKKGNEFVNCEDNPGPKPWEPIPPSPPYIPKPQETFFP